MSTLLKRSAVALAILAVLWTGVWYAAAEWLDRRFVAATGDLAAQGGARVVCGERSVTGFPFAMKFACTDDVMVEADGAGFALTTIDAGLSLASPSTLEFSIAGPGQRDDGARQRRDRRLAQREPQNRRPLPDPGDRPGST